MQPRSWLRAGPLITARPTGPAGEATGYPGPMPRRAVPRRPRLRVASTLLTTGVLGAGAGLLYAAARARPPRPNAAPPMPPAGLPPARVEVVPGRGEFFLRDTGSPATPDAPTVVLVHGWMFSSDANWFTCYQPLAEVGRVLAADQRGHGRGPRPSTPFRLADSADDLAALLHHLGTGPVVVVGYSMGGAVAQLLWRRHPELVRALVLCATSATFNRTARDRWVWRTMGVLQVALRMIPRHWWESLVERQAAGQLPVRVSRLVHTDSPPELVDLLPWFVSELDRGSAEDIAEAGRELGRYDARAWVSQIDVPSAVVVTADDELVPRANQLELAERIPGCLVEEVPLDHDAVGAHPDVFVPALVRAIKSVV